jgi:hypothetical protein
LALAQDEAGSQKSRIDLPAVFLFEDDGEGGATIGGLEDRVFIGAVRVKDDCLVLVVELEDRRGDLDAGTGADAEVSIDTDTH